MTPEELERLKQIVDVADAERYSSSRLLKLLSIICAAFEQAKEQAVQMMDDAILPQLADAIRAMKKE